MNWSWNWWKSEPSLLLTTQSMTLSCGTGGDFRCRFKSVVFWRTDPLCIQATCGAGNPKASGQVRFKGDLSKTWTCVGWEGLSLKNAEVRREWTMQIREKRKNEFCNLAVFSKCDLILSLYISVYVKSVYNYCKLQWPFIEIYVKSTQSATRYLCSRSRRPLHIKWGFGFPRAAEYSRNVQFSWACNKTSFSFLWPLRTHLHSEGCCFRCCWDCHLNGELIQGKWTI